MHTIVEIIKDHLQYKQQIFKLAKADLVKTYRGAALGWAWAIIKPAVTIFVYWFTFEIGLRAGKGILAHAADEYRKSILKIIEDQPVAFEKEKVHSELIELRNAEVFKPDFATKHEENWSHGRYSAFLDAIRIVEKGGIE